MSARPLPNLNFPGDLPAELMQQLKSGRDLVQRAHRSNEPWQTQDRFPTTFAELDELLGGGLARREMVEIIGRRTSGRFSIALATLAAASQQGEAVAFVDMGDNLDPLSADRAGVDLERLLWLRPRHLKKALAAVEILIGGGFPLVVFDLGNPPVPGGRGIEAGWLRLARAAQDHDGALLVMSPYRASGTAARAVFELHKRRGRWYGRHERTSLASSTRAPSPAPAPYYRGPAPHLLHGLDTEIVLEKSRGRLSGAALLSSIDLELSLQPESLAEPLKIGAMKIDAERRANVHGNRPRSLKAVGDEIEKRFNAQGSSSSESTGFEPRLIDARRAAR